MEEWKPIIGYEWLYEVSSLGRIQSLNYRRSWKGKIMKWAIGKYGHSRLTLCLNWIKLSNYIHRIVAICFIQNPLRLNCVCHKQEDLDENWALYNWVDNLFWWTYQDNIIDKHIKWRSNNHLQLNHPMKWKFWKNHNRSKTILQYKKDWKITKEWWSMKDIERALWILQSDISKCCRWKWKTAGGFIWKFKD